MTETVEALQGGYVTQPTRVGDTVRRARTYGDVEFGHDLLRYFGRCGWPGAPRFLGMDERGREILTYIDGHVAWEPDQPESVWSQGSLVRVGQLVREMHDLTAGTALAGDDEVVCHNDLSPRNTVYRDEGDGYMPVAFIDWDGAAPGARIHDVAHMSWQFAIVGEPRDPALVASAVRLMCDGYGLADRSAVVDTILWWQDRCWRGIEAKANAGVQAMVRLRDLGGVGWVQADYDWVAKHRADLDRALA
jgi:hypothetical protein